MTAASRQIVLNRVWTATGSLDLDVVAEKYAVLPRDYIRRGAMTRHPRKRSHRRRYEDLRTHAASAGAGRSIGAKAVSTLTDYANFGIIRP